MADLIERFPTETGVSLPEGGTSTDRFDLAQALATETKLIPWSKYIPFAKGTDLHVGGKIFLGISISFSGVAKIEELTDTELDFSVVISRIELPFGINADFATVTISAKITYVGEGSNNKAVFSVGGPDQEKTVHIQSKSSERVLTPPGGLQLKTDLEKRFPLAPETVELRELHIVPAKNQVALRVVMAFPIPEFTITIS
jgi:hypothetical protein